METTQRTTTHSTKQGNRCGRETSAVGALARRGLIAAALAAVVAFGSVPAHALMSAGPVDVSTTPLPFLSSHSSGRAQNFVTPPMRLATTTDSNGRSVQIDRRWLDGAEAVDSVAH